MMSKTITASQLLLWEDEHLLCVNKPPGLLTIPDGYDPLQNNLLGLLESEYGHMWTIHRLDVGTSGVILFARTAYAHQALNQQFEHRQVEKIYHALVAGRPLWDTTEVELALRVDGGRRHRTVIDSRDGKPAATSFKVLETFRGYTLLEARPHTGYTHQIRVHLASTGFPVVADDLYGNGKTVLLSAIKPRYKASQEPENPLMERTGLHARLLRFEHPISHQTTEIEAPYPKDFAVTLRQLRKFS